MFLCSRDGMYTTELTSQLVDIHPIVVPSRRSILPNVRSATSPATFRTCTAVASHVAVDPSHLRTSQSIEVLHYKLNSQYMVQVTVLAMQAVRCGHSNLAFLRFSPF